MSSFRRRVGLGLASLTIALGCGCAPSPANLKSKFVGTWRSTAGGPAILNEDGSINPPGTGTWEVLDAQRIRIVFDNADYGTRIFTLAPDGRALTPDTSNPKPGVYMGTLMR